MHLVLLTVLRIAAVVQEPVAIPRVHTSVVITDTVLEPSVDRRNQVVFKDTLFSRDDQIFHQLAAAAGRLDRYGFLGGGDGGRTGSGIVSGYFRQETNRGTVWKVDGFVSRSLFDLYSNFTFFLNSPQGDAIQQHDSRLQQGSNAQYRARFAKAWNSPRDRQRRQSFLLRDAELH